MKRIITSIAAIAFSIALVTSAEAKKPAGEKKKADPEAAFKKADKDNDGFVSKAEATAGKKDAAKAEAAFAKKDKDNDGKLSKEEFMARGRKKK